MFFKTIFKTITKINTEINKHLNISIGNKNKLFISLPNIKTKEKRKANKLSEMGK